MAIYPELQNKVVLITGGANGIGAAMARAFNGQGARVRFCDLDTKAGKALERDLDPGARFARVDLCREAEIKRWIGRVAASEKSIDVLINNAARDPRIPLEKTSAREWDALMAGNLRAGFLACREASPHIPRGGVIINFSSINFHNGPEEMAAYVATKSAWIGLTRSLARELGPRRIRVNTISPGWIMTERQLRQYITPAIRRELRKVQCIPDLNQPEEVAEVALFLASDASRAVTGQELLVDRGWTHG